MKVYEVLIAGVPHTVQLDDDEAKRLGVEPVKGEVARKPANKARTAKNKKG